MESDSRNKRQVLLLGLLTVVITLVVFPNKLGTTTMDASFLLIGLELVFYGLWMFFFDRSQGIGEIFKRSGLCLAFRLTMALTFGVLAAPMFLMTFTAALKAAIFGYAPGVLLMTLVTPFVMRSLYETPVRRRAVTPRGTTPVPATGTNLVLTKGSNRPVPQPTPVPAPSNVSGAPMSSKLASEQRANSEEIVNGFDQAIRHVSIDSSVELALLVDFEGLLLSKFVRDDLDAESYAPFASIMFDQMTQTLERTMLKAPERMELTLDDRKLYLVRSGGNCLMVLAERHADDLLSIRVSQGIDIANKYIAERYGEKSPVNSEIAYV